MSSLCKGLIGGYGHWYGSFFSKKITSFQFLKQFLLPGNPLRTGLFLSPKSECKKYW
jgi:hypothetical protein